MGILQELQDKKFDLDIFFSGICNMDCAYCYIPKSEYLSVVNKEVTENLINGKLVESLAKLSDSEDITDIGLWGAEPTVNYQYVKPFFELLFQKFKHIKKVDFSTNFLMGASPSITMIEQLNECAKLLPSGKLELVEVQISLDGPKWVTDKNRKEGATEKIVEGYKEFIRYFTKYKPENIDLVEYHFKPTLNADNFREMLEDKNKTIEWFRFMEELYDYGFKHNLPFFKCRSVPYMTLENPGDFSSEDGKIFAKWLKEVYKIDPKEVGLKYFRQPLFNQQLYNLEKLLIYARPPYSVRMYTCGGGSASITADYKNRVYPCHRAFSLTHYTPEERNSFRNKFFIQRISGNLDDKQDATKTIYMLNGYHHFNQFRIEFVKNAIRALACVGQVDEIYLKDEILLEYFALFVATALCFVGYSADKTNSVNVPNLSYIRLFGNGAFQIMFKILLDKYMKEDI